MAGYDYLEKARFRLRVINTFIRLVARPVKRNWHYVEGYLRRRTSSPVSIEYDTRYNLLDLVIELPGSRPVRYIIYVSAQQARPLSPKQLVAKINRILSTYRKKTTPMDTAKYMICPGGYTSYAEKMLRAHKIIPARTDKQVLENMAKYFKNRYTKLIDSIRGKRLFGKVALLAYLLQQIIKELGETITEDPLEQYLNYYPSPLILAEQGAEIPAPH